MLIKPFKQNIDASIEELTTPEQYRINTSKNEIYITECDVGPSPVGITKYYDVVLISEMIANKRIQTTKKNDIMAFLELEDLYGTIEVIVFPQTLKQYNSILNEDNIIYIKGKLSIKEEESAKLIAREIRDINDKDSLKINNHNNSYIKNKKQSKTGIFVKIDSLENQQLINSIEKISLQYKGNQDIYVCTEQPKKMFRWEKIKVNINSELQLKLQELLGQENVIVKN